MTTPFAVEVAGSATRTKKLRARLPLPIFAICVGPLESGWLERHVGVGMLARGAIVGATIGVVFGLLAVVDRAVFAKSSWRVVSTPIAAAIAAIAAFGASLFASAIG